MELLDTITVCCYSHLLPWRLQPKQARLTGFKYCLFCAFSLVSFNKKQPELSRMIIAKKVEIGRKTKNNNNKKTKQKKKMLNLAKVH